MADDVRASRVMVGRAQALLEAVPLARTYKRDKDGKFGSGGDAEAVTGEAALQAAPYRLGHPGGPDSSNGVSRDRMDKALASYSGMSHATTNHDLRNQGDGPVAPRSRRAVKAMDAALASSQLTADVEVVRRVPAGPLAFGGTWQGRMKGVTFRDAGFVSTSANKDLQQVPGYRSTSASAAIMHIRVPKGTHALSMSRPGDDTGEMELLLDRGLTYRITGHRTIKGQRHFDVEVVPADG
jgi:hypothetical protein